MAGERPSELKSLVGCLIKTSYDTGGRVIEVKGPYPPDPDWLHGRAWLGGYTIVYEDGTSGKCWINEVFVEDGVIYAHPWRDVIEVADDTGAQMKLF